MKLEGIDPRHPSLYCVLTVAELKGHRLRLHFDEYPECYDFWVNDDSPLIFYAGWAEKYKKKLLPPKGTPALLSSSSNGSIHAYVCFLSFSRF